MVLTHFAWLVALLTPPGGVSNDAPVRARAPLRIAVYEIKAPDSERVAAIVTASLVAELRKLDGVVVVGIDEVRAMLDHEAAKQLVGCTDDNCLSEIAASLGVDEIVVGSIAKVGDDTVFGLRRLDQREARALGQVDQRLKSAGGEELLAAVGPSVAALYPDHALRAGKKRGVAPEMALRLNPPLLDPWIVYAGSGITVAGALASGALTFIWAGNESAVSTFDKNALSSGAVASGPDRQRLVAASDTSFIVATVALSTTAALAAGTGVAAAFADWDNLRAGAHLEAE